MRDCNRFFLRQGADYDSHVYICGLVSFADSRQTRSNELDRDSLSQGATTDHQDTLQRTGKGAAHDPLIWPLDLRSLHRYLYTAAGFYAVRLLLDCPTAKRRRALKVYIYEESQSLDQLFPSSFSRPFHVCQSSAAITRYLRRPEGDCLAMHSNFAVRVGLGTVDSTHESLIDPLHNVNDANSPPSI